jgi:hypothetical protein
MTRHPLLRSLITSCARALLVTSLLSAPLLITGCGPKSDFAAPIKPMPAGATFKGKWYSEEYKIMKVYEKDGKIFGTFTLQKGGTFEGTAEGGVLIFDWFAEGDLSEGTKDISGKGYLVISDDGKALKGERGILSKHTGKPWTASKMDDNPDAL